MTPRSLAFSRSTGSKSSSLSESYPQTKGTYEPPNVVEEVMAPSQPSFRSSISEKSAICLYFPLGNLIFLSPSSSKGVLIWFARLNPLARCSAGDAVIMYGVDPPGYTKRTLCDRSLLYLKWQNWRMGSRRVFPLPQRRSRVAVVVSGPGSTSRLT